MAIYQKEDLLFSDYDWKNASDHVKFNGMPDRNMFVRYEGNDVLYMINCVCAAMNDTSRQHAANIERLIHEKLPIEIKSQNSVFNWLQENYTE